jgi:hypothetical protein
LPKLHFPPRHWPEQHCELEEQDSPSVVQEFAPVHTPWHVPEQHSRLELQTVESTLQAPAVEHLPVASQNSEQQSVGSVHAEPAPLQEPGTLQRFLPSTY